MVEVRQSARVTIVDVAAAAGVSRQTVSNVVNRPEIVAARTREAVEAQIERLGYRATRAARQLRRDLAGAWGFELDSSGVGRMGSVLDTFLIELTAQAHRINNTHVMPFVVDPGDPLRAYRDLVVGRHVDGFVVAHTHFDDPRPGWLKAQRVPFASFGRIWGNEELADWVDVDGAAGVRAAVAHVQSCGYDRIGFFGWPPGSPVGDDRRGGWAESVPSGSPSAVAEQSVEAAVRAAGPLIDQVGRGGAIVCASDVLAAGVWRCLTERGGAPGRDIGIVGFDDSDLAHVLGLTSLAQPLREVARHLLGLLGGSATGSRLLEPRLVIRPSTSPQTEASDPAGAEDPGDPADPASDGGSP